MKVVIITDTPTTLTKSSLGKSEFSGSYRSITTARLRLQEEGHEVNTIVILNDLTAFSEQDLLKMLTSHPDLILAKAREGVNLSDVLKHSTFDALFVSLTTDKLQSLIPSIFRVLKKTNPKPIIFIGAGRKTQKHVQHLSDVFKIPVNVFGKPGVARITSKGLSTFLSALRM